MKTIYITILVLLFTSPLNLNGQNLKIEFSSSFTIQNVKSYEDNLKTFKANRIFDFFNDTYLVVDDNVKILNSNFEIQKSRSLSEFNNAKALHFSNYFHRLGQRENQYVFPGVFQSENKLFLTTSFVDKKADISTFYSTELNSKDLSSGLTKTLFERAFTKAMILVSVGNYHYNNMISNKSKSYFLFYEIGDKSGLNISGEVLDASLNKKFSVNSNFKEIGGTIQVQDIIVTEDGSILIGITSYQGLQLPSKKYTHYILQIKENTSELITLNKTDNHITEFKIIENDKSIYVVGFTSNADPSELEVTGTYFASLIGNKLEEKYENFPEEFITKYNSKSKSINSLNLLKHFVIDNNIYLIGEERIKKSTGGPSSAAFFDWFYKDIIICKLSTKGENIWSRKIDKNQEKILSGGSGELFEFSAGIEVINNQVVLVYADNKANIVTDESKDGNNFNEKDIDYLRDGYSGYIVCATVISSDGNVKVNKFDQNILNKYRLLPYNTFKKGNEIIVYLDDVDTKATSKTSYKFATISTN